jgi:hypothetical protein
MLAVFGSRCWFEKSDSAAISWEATDWKNAPTSTPTTTLRRRLIHKNRTSHVSAARTGIRFRLSSLPSARTLPAQKATIGETTMGAVNQEVPRSTLLPPPPPSLSPGSRRKSVVWDDRRVRGTLSIDTCALRMHRLSRMRTWCFLAVVQWVSLISAH